MIDFSGQTVAVTGGCGTLGKAMSIRLEELGAKVLLLDRESSNPKKIADELSVSNRITGIQVDITDEVNVVDIFQEISVTYGALHAVINSAAATGEMIVRDGGAFPSFSETSLSAWRAVMSVNIDGNFLVAREVGKIFLAQGYGNLLNISSIYGIRGPDHRIYEDQKFSSFAAYSASKAAVHGLTMWLATYWANKNIRVNTLVPGGVFNNHEKSFEQSYSNRVPMGRMATPNDMIGMALLLISDQSAYITGQQFIVDGGLSAW
jgi:NAD(P)-dependent dehydrogenase (short-subunit alcohol dehydrogenase family)